MGNLHMLLYIVGAGLLPTLGFLFAHVNVWFYDSSFFVANIFGLFF